MKLKRREIAALLAFVALIAVFWISVNGFAVKENEKELDLIRTAVKNAALNCYSVEGSYPMDIDYLRENYGLAYNEDRFTVFYDAFASNLLPTIRVVERGTSVP